MSETTRARSDRRLEFLSSLLVTGVAAANYWAVDIDEVTVDHGEHGIVYLSVTLGPLEPCDFEPKAITLGDIEDALNLVKSGEIEFFNPGYRREPTAARMKLLDETDGWDSDYDAWDADCILQIAMFGEIAYG
ncbi:hypothetical protein SEA_SPEEDDEMON_1400 [Gordonia phage SpeedDemon]|nr:hypothetical protein SEA_SPEEDDEMON_1400 [Gordonia phage SpeedDemon]